MNISRRISRLEQQTDEVKTESSAVIFISNGRITRNGREISPDDLERARLAGAFIINLGEVLWTPN